MGGNGRQMITVYTGGTFDLFHSGHVNLLKRCRDIAGPKGRVVVALNSDEFIREYKGASPVCDDTERHAVVSSSQFVDEVVFNSGGADSKPTIDLVKPDYIVIGSDWARRDYYTQMGFDQDWLDSRNIGLVYIPYTKHISTTAIKKRMS